MNQPLQYILWVLKYGGKESLSRVLKDPFAKEAVDLLSKLGYPELIMRTDGIRVIQQNTPKYDSTSAGLVENAVKQVKEKVRVLVIGARELHGATIDRSHLTLPWCIRFAGQALSRTVKGHDGTEELIMGTPTGCKICRLVKRRSKADAADPIFFNSVRGTPWCLVPDDAVQEELEFMRQLQVYLEVPADLVLKAGEPEEFEAYRLLLRRYEPQTTATTATKLFELLSTQFAGDLVDCVADFERVMASKTNVLKVAASMIAWQRQSDWR